MKIAYFESTDEQVHYLRPLLREHDVRWIPARISPEEAARVADVEAIAVSLGGTVSRRVLSQLPALKYLATRSTGFDHVDLEACRHRGIAVSNVPYYGENTVAEHTFALILGLSRRVQEGVQRTRQRNFSIQGLEGFDLKGRTLGIVGVGRIGARVARIARAFDMRVVVADTVHSEVLAAVLDFAYLPFYNVLAEADILTLHVPLTPATRHLIDRQAVASMRRGALLVNTARGEVVDTEALLHGLDTGILSGAALDVLEGEEEIREEAELLARPLSPQTGGVLLRAHRLLDRPNVLVTPHIGFYSREAIERILLTTADNLAAFAAGEPQNLVQ